MTETIDDDPPAVAWKRAYLSLADAIEDFQIQRLQGAGEFRPPVDHPSQGNVGRLLLYHLNRCRELLWAEVNGGLDEHYQEEIDQLTASELEAGPHD